MSLQNLALYKAMNAKMVYLDKRQGVLAQNIANADTPGYQSQDLTKVDFGSVLRKVTKSTTSGLDPVHMVSTNARHMPSPNHIDDSRNVADKITYEVAPDSNGVVVEEQMVKANQTQMDYALLSNLLMKHSGMYKTAIGRQG